MDRNHSVFASPLFLGLMALIGIGVVQVYSSSFVLASENFNDGLFFFKKQMLYAAVGFLVMVFFSQIKWKWIEKYGFMVWILGTVLVLITLIPGVGVKVGGAQRWIPLFNKFRLQPSEILIYSFALLYATLANREESFLAKLPNWGIFAVFTAPMLLLLKQPDFGSFAIISAVGLGLLVAFGLRKRYIGLGLAVVIPLFYFLVMNVDYRRKRILAFLDPWADAEQKGFQVIQSMMSFQAGGLSGAGLGQGQGKLFFLPEAHTDFTLSVLGEEWGFIGMLALYALYGFIIFRCFQLAMKVTSKFQQVVVLGVALTFTLAVFINSGVVMGLLPTKGLALPFLSYGGSSLVTLCMMFGIVLNIERQRHQEQQNPFFRSQVGLK